MNNDQQFKYILEDGEEQETVDLAGYQVTKAELFAHTREPAITVWDNRIKFNMACLRKFPGVTHIQLLIHPDELRLIVRPCLPDAPDSLRWASGGGEREIKNRDMICQIFAAKLFELMNWNKEYRYKMLGKPAVYNNVYTPAGISNLDNASTVFCVGVMISINLLCVLCSNCSLESLYL